jgi:hypothetical protein
MEREERVVIDVVVELARPQRKAGDDLAAIHRLPGAGHRAGFDQFNNAIRDHLRVYPEVLFPFEEAEQGLGNASDPELERATVFDEAGDVLSDLSGGICHVGRRHFEDGGIGRHQHVNVIDVDLGVAQRARHVRVDLGNDQRGVLRGAFNDVHRHTQAADAMFVRGGDMDQRHVQRKLAGIE